MPGVLVTATDTGVGKTVLAAAIVAALAARGQPVVAFKPAVTGLDEPEPGVPADHELLGRCAGMDPGAVSPYTFGPPASPHHAARLAGVTIDVPRMIAQARAAAAGATGTATTTTTATATLVVEGVGGLLVPLAPGWDIRAFAAALGLPVVIAARPGLGTINHTLLTLEAARAAGLDVRAVVLTPWPSQPSALQESNRETIAELGAVTVSVLPRLARLEPTELGQAGAGLPLDRWLARS